MTIPDGPTIISRPSTPPPTPSCPSELPPPFQMSELLFLDATMQLTSYKHFYIQYATPMGATSAMLTFEFITQQGKWYLDDVSMKAQNDDAKEIISNGGFETGNLAPNWQYCHAIHPWFGGGVENQFVHTGAFSYASADFSLDSRDYLTQVVEVEGFTNYIIEFYLFCTGTITS
ncbi:unnamed protein product, partial [Rotaria sp. Silwood2]